MPDRIIVQASIGYLVRREDGWHFVQPAAPSEPFGADLDMALGCAVLTETDVKRVFGEHASLGVDVVTIGGKP